MEQIRKREFRREKKGSRERESRNGYRENNSRGRR